MKGVADARLGDLLRLALDGTGAACVELKCAGSLLGGAPDVRVVVQLRRAGEVIMTHEHKTSDAPSGRGYARAIADLLGEKVYIDDRLDHPRDARGRSKSVGQIGQERIDEAVATIAQHRDDVARELAVKVREWVATRLGRPMRDSGVAFYTPSEWKVRGESHGDKAVMVMVHDGSDLSPFVNYDYGAYDDIEAFSAFLGTLGYYVEDANGWSSGIYPIS